MRITISIILFIASTSAIAQEPEENKISFRIFCGWGGLTSPEIQHIQILTKSRNYILLSNKLFGNNKAEAVLSAISLSELYSQKHLALEIDDQKRIEEIKKWNLKYSICYTCTGHFTGSIKELFRNNMNSSYVLIRTALFDSL